MDKFRGGCSADAGFMVPVKVLIEGSVCCACTGVVRVFVFAASHGRRLVEEVIATETLLICPDSPSSSKRDVAIYD